MGPPRGHSACKNRGMGVVGGEGKGVASKKEKHREIVQKAARGTKKKLRKGAHKRKGVVCVVSERSGGGGHSHAERQLGVRGERDLKGNLRHGASIPCKVTTV